MVFRRLFGLISWSFRLHSKNLTARGVRREFLSPAPRYGCCRLASLGAVSLLQGISGVSKDVPPFSIAIGKNGIAAINVIGLRRAGFGAALRTEVKSAFEIVVSEPPWPEAGARKCRKTDLGAGK
jgi:Udp N-acetylglucosamine O-acyltransferase